MPGKLILAISAVVFVAYGLISLMSPAVPAGFAGLVMTNGDAFAEIGSMYGGLQTGVGLYCLLALFKTEYYRGGLAILVIGIGMLAAGRLISAIVTDESLSAYTWGALTYEFITVFLAGLALRRSYQMDNMA